MPSVRRNGLSGSAVRPAVGDGLSKKGDDVCIVASPNVAKLDMPKILAGAFQDALRIMQRGTVIETEVHV